MGYDGAPLVPDPPADGDALRAQLLATEHWGLLAARSTTQNEVLTRIAVLLTLTSAVLVSIALVGQATHFSALFTLFANVFLLILTIVGVLPHVRVANVNMEDLMYVLAMNRLRAAYEQLSPGIGVAFMASEHDDFLGSRQTYYFLGRRGISQVAGSSLLFIAVVDSALVGLLLSSVVVTVGADLVVGVVVGSVVAVVYLVASVWISARMYFRFWERYTPLNPSPAEG